MCEVGDSQLEYQQQQQKIPLTLTGCRTDHPTPGLSLVGQNSASVRSTDSMRTGHLLQVYMTASGLSAGWGRLWQQEGL